MTEPMMWAVPPDTPAGRCTGPHCNAVIYFVTNPATGSSIPVNCDVPGGTRPRVAPVDAPVPGVSGLGVNHFTDCPDAPRFHRRKGNEGRR